MRRQLTIAICIGSALAVEPAVVRAGVDYCTYTTDNGQPYSWGGSPRTIDVYLAAGSGPALGIDTDDTIFGEAVSRATQIWNEESGAAIKLRWRGTQTVTDHIDGAITVFGGPHTPCTGDYADSSEAADPSTGLVYYAYINVWQAISTDSVGTCGETITWRTDVEDDDIAPGTAGNPRDLVAILVHELGHAGELLNHPGDSSCNVTPEPISVMGSRTVNGVLMPAPHRRVIRHYDKRAAQASSANRAAYSTLKWLTWDDGTETWANELNLIGLAIGFRFGSLSQLFPYTVLAWTEYPTELPNVYGQVRSTYYLSSDESFNASQVLADGNELAGLPGVVAVAASDSQSDEVLVAYKKEDPAFTLYTNDTNFLCYRMSHDAGFTFDPEVCTTPSGTAVIGSIRFGETAAYDPVTRNFLIAEASNDGTLRVITVPGSGSTVGYRNRLLPAASWHAPSIACGVNGTDNCIIAWEDKSDFGCLTWAKGHVDTTSLQLSNRGLFVISEQRQQCYEEFDTPSVAYYQADDTFRLGFEQGNFAAYSAEMSATTGTSWAGTPDIYNNFNAFISPPVMATEHFCLFSCSDNLRGWLLRYF